VNGWVSVIGYGRVGDPRPPGRLLQGTRSL
jgi:hypothetical protein